MKAGLDTFAKKLEYFKKMNKLGDNDISTYQAVFDKADDDRSGKARRRDRCQGAAHRTRPGA